MPFFSIKTGLHKAAFPALQNNFGQLQDKSSILYQNYEQRMILGSFFYPFPQGSNIHSMRLGRESSHQVGTLSTTSVKAHRDSYLRSTPEEPGATIQDVGSKLIYLGDLFGVTGRWTQQWALQRYWLKQGLRETVVCTDIRTSELGQLVPHCW